MPNNITGMALLFTIVQQQPMAEEDRIGHLAHILQEGAGVPAGLRVSICCCPALPLPACSTYPPATPSPHRPTAPTPIASGPIPLHQRPTAPMPPVPAPPQMPLSAGSTAIAGPGHPPLPQPSRFTSQLFPFDTGKSAKIRAGMKRVSRRQKTYLKSETTRGGVGGPPRIFRNPGKSLHRSKAGPDRKFQGLFTEIGPE